MKNSIPFTKEGFEKIKLELDDLLKIKQPKAIDRLGKARAMGDLSENSEYTAAKEDRTFIAGRITQLEEVIKRAVVVWTLNDSGVVEIGSKIKVTVDAIPQEFELVGEYEADPLNHKLSHISPLGKALLGKKVGDQVEAQVPSGRKIYKIIDIQKT